MGVLRALLALSVVAAHSGGYWPSALSGVGGEAAVEAFFVVSGFYMALVLGRTYAGRTRAFLLNRGLRIYPEYWIVALASAIAIVVMDSTRFDQFAGLPLAAKGLLATANTFIFGTDAAMFLQVNDGHLSLGPFQESNPPLFTLLLVPQAWTLALELTFYLLAPWLVRLSSAALAGTTAVLLGSKFLVAGLLLQLPDPWTYRFIGFEMAYFLIGILLFRYWLSRGREWSVRAGWRSRGSLIGCVIAVMLVAPWLRRLGNHWGIFTGQYIATGIVVACLAALVPALFSATRTSRADARIGEFSYPIYLSHLLALGLVGVAVGRLSLGDGPTLALSLTVVLAFSWALVVFGHFLDPLRDRVRGVRSSLPPSTHRHSEQRITRSER